MPVTHSTMTRRRSLAVVSWVTWVAWVTCDMRWRSACPFAAAGVSLGLEARRRPGPDPEEVGQQAAHEGGPCGEHEGDGVRQIRQQAQAVDDHPVHDQRAGGGAVVARQAL